MAVEATIRFLELPREHASLKGPSLRDAHARVEDYEKVLNSAASPATQPLVDG